MTRHLVIGTLVALACNVAVADEMGSGNPNNMANQSDEFSTEGQDSFLTELLELFGFESDTQQ